MTSKQQIDRLLRPGSTYLNLNPFEVLQIDPELPIDEVKKKYRRLSILVHPDKNQDDADRAQQAFEAVNKAWKILENEVTRKKCMEVIEEAKGRTDIMVCINCHCSLSSNYSLLASGKKEKGKERRKGQNT